MGIILATAFVFGASLGSFFLAQIERFRRGENEKSRTRSECASCKRKLTGLELIPIVSYLIQHGKCRSCKSQIPKETLIMEITTGLLLVSLLLPALMQWPISVSMTMDEPVSLIILLSYIVLFYLATLYDIYFLLIPVSILASLILLSLADQGWHMNTSIWLQKAVGGGLATILMGGQYLATRRKGIGSGDILITISIGFLLGWELLLMTLFISYLIGSLVGLAMLATKKTYLKAKISLVPFLFAGLLLTLAFGKSLLEWYKAFF